MEKTEQSDHRNSLRNNRRNFLGVAFLHFVNDLHSNALPTLIPMLIKSISISLGQAGLINAFFGVTHIIGQPVFGFLADKQKRPFIALIGVVLCTAGAVFMPLVPNFATAIVLACVLSTGTAMFHPQGMGICGRSGGKENLAFFLSIFTAFGSFGSAVGPLYIVFVISLVGKKGLPLVLIPVVALSLFVWHTFTPFEDSEKIKIKSDADKNGERFYEKMKSVLSKIKWIFITATLRDSTTQGLRLFLPVLMIMRGGTIAAGGFVLFAVTASGTAAGVIGGKISDKVGHRKILIATLSVAPFFLLAGLHSSKMTSLLLLMAGFALVQASSPITTAMAQQLCPDARSVASSLSMGVSWGLANLMTFPIGYAADRIGLQNTMYIVAFIPWIVTAWQLAKIALHREQKSL